jgi:hypothetical protein
VASHCDSGWNIAPDQLPSRYSGPEAANNYSHGPASPILGGIDSLRVFLFQYFAICICHWYLLLRPAACSWRLRRDAHFSLLARWCQAMLTISGVALVGFNLYALAHYDLRHLVPAIRLFCMGNGLFIGIAIASAVFLRRKGNALEDRTV